METITEAKVDKRTKEYKERQEIYSAQDESQKFTVENLIKIGIPMRKVVFTRTVVSHGDATGTSVQSALFAYPNKDFKGRPDTNDKSKMANIWFTPHCYVVEQKGQYKIIPKGAVTDSDVL